MVFFPKVCKKSSDIRGNSFWRKTIRFVSIVISKKFVKRGLNIEDNFCGGGQSGLVILPF
jgi:hypothetical protein